MKDCRTQIISILTPLIGLQLSIARRGGPMRVFHFGPIVEEGKGSVGSFALHLQCAWRLEQWSKVITGVDDLWRASDPEKNRDNWSYEDGGSAQEDALQELLGGYDERTRSWVNRSARLVVTAVDSTNLGDVTISMSDDVLLRLFVSSSNNEAWRFFAPSRDDRHHIFEAGALM